MHIVYLLGVDGTGKTTLCRRLASDFSGHYIYCGSGRGLRRKLRVLARRLFIKDSKVFQSYEKYERIRDEARRQKPGLVRLYGWFQYANLFCVSWTKLTGAWLRGGVAVLDRYSLDAAVAVACLRHHPSERMLRHARILQWLLPRPDLTLYLDVDEETACSRKKDVASPEFLREKIRRYQDLLLVYRWKTIDSRQTLDEVHSQALALIAERFGNRA